VGVRADAVLGQGAQPLGFIVMLIDLSESKRTQAARLQLESSLSQAARSGSKVRSDARLAREGEDVVAAILANVNRAALEIVDTAQLASLAPTLHELETSAKRAAELYGQMQAYSRINPASN
jgi:hypothetical protein